MCILVQLPRANGEGKHREETCTSRYPMCQTCQAALDKRDGFTVRCPIIGGSCPAVGRLWAATTITTLIQLNLAFVHSKH